MTGEDTSLFQTQSRRWGMRMIAASASIAAVLTAGWLVVENYLDHVTLESVINSVIDPATDGMYRVEIGGASVDWWSASIQAHDVHLIANEGQERHDVAFELSVSTLELDEVEIWKAITGGGLEFKSLTIAQPDLRIRTSEVDDDDDDEVGPSEPVDIQELDAKRREKVPHILIDEIHIIDAKAEIDGVDAIEGLSIRLINIDVDPHKSSIDGKVMYAEDVQVEIDRVRFDVGPHTQLLLTKLKASSLARTAQFERMAVHATETEADYYARHVDKKDRADLDLGPVRVAGIDFARFVEEFDLVADRIEVDHLRAEIASDRRFRDGPRQSTNAKAAPHGLANAGFPIRVREVAFKNTTVRYAEFAPDGGRAGSMEFTNLHGTIENASTRAGAGPMIARASGGLNGSGVLSLVMSIPLDKPAPTMDIHGTVEGLDLTVLDTILPPLLGVRIKQGAVRHAVFDLHYGTKRIKGTAGIGFDHMKLRLEDKITGKQNARLGFFSALAPLLVKSKSIDREGHVKHQVYVDSEVSPHDPFWKVFWIGLRDAIGKSLLKGKHKKGAPEKEKHQKKEHQKKKHQKKKHHKGE